MVQARWRPSTPSNKTLIQKQRILSLSFIVMTKFLQELQRQMFEGNMSKVLVLNVWECDSLKTLPAELGRYASLRTLSIDHCPSLYALPADSNSSGSRMRSD